jgi:hypothetical protein
VKDGLKLNFTLSYDGKICLFQENVEVLKEKLKDDTIISISAKVGTNVALLLKTLRSMYDDSMKKQIVGSNAMKN